MMRYQRVSPDGLPSSNGNKKPNSRTTTTCKQDINGDHGRTISNRFLSSTTSFESKPLRFRSPSRTNQDVNGVVNGAPDSPSISDHHNHASHSPSRVGGGGGDGLLQWGIKKRARVSRSDIRSLTDDESSSSSAVAINKVQWRATEAEKMLPPPPPPPQQPPTSAASNSRIANPRTENPIFLPNHHRKLEERSATENGSPSRSGVRSVSRSSAAGKRSPPAMEKIDRKMPYSRSVKDEKRNASIAQAATPAQSAQEAMTTTPSTGLEKKVGVEVIEWPRIYISLSRKEKEEDFLAMKGTKLPQRPKKRAKNVDKTLQFCFPGMWLSDLTRSRYEVREKKSVKKQKRRGLKGMGSMDSDSE